MIDTRTVTDLFTKLNARQDVDIGMYYLEQYVFKDPMTKEKLPASDSITLNDPRTFADAVMAILAADKRLFEITGIDQTYQSELEDALRHWLYLNDEILTDQLIEPLETCLNFHASLRGWLVGIPLVYKDGDKIQPVIIPVDPRWARWKVGARGFEWGSYRVGIDKALIEDKYKVKIRNQGKGKIATVECIMTENEYFLTAPDTTGSTAVESIPLHSITHGIGFTPFVVQPRPTQPMIISANNDYALALSRQGESIYASNRDIYPKLNEIASVWSSINLQQFLTPVAYVGNRTFKERPFGIGIVVELKPGEQLIEIPTKEMSASAQNLFGRLAMSAQQGSMSSINYGQLSFELSALAVAQLKDERDKVFIPTRKCKQTFYRKCFDMWRRQIVNNKFYPTDIDDDNWVDTIDNKLFEKKFMVNIAFNSISPEENIANYQLAQQAKALGVPMEKIYADIMRYENVQEVLMKKKGEDAAMMVPALNLFEAAIAYSDRNVEQKRINEIKANIIYKHLIDEMKQPIGQEFGGEGGEGGFGGLPGYPSQPKIEPSVNRPQSEKLAANMQKQSGYVNQQSARRAKRTEQ